MWKYVLCLAVGLVGIATTQRSYVKSPVCQEECGRFFSLQAHPFEQSACLQGCEFFNRIQQRTGEDPIQTLKNCNYSCDERHVGEDVHACQAGCGFNYDVASSHISPAPRIETVQPSSQPFIIPVSLPKLFGQIHAAMPRLNQIMERTFNLNPFNEFDMPPILNSLPSMPKFPGGFLGRKDTDEGVSTFDDFFSTINNQMNNMMKSMPSIPRIENLNPWSAFPFGGGAKSGGKITVVNAGPGFVEEKHYDIKPDGEIVEITQAPATIDHDGLAHENPMEANAVHADVDVEMIKPETETDPVHSDAEESNPIESVVELVSQQENESKLREQVKEEKDDDVVDVSEVPAPRVDVRPDIEFSIDQVDQVDPFLHILRNSISERDRSEFYNQYKSLHKNQYVDNNSCSSEHLRWSDWVGCVHVRLGVPRWLTAATIALGIIFSVWLCFIIPTAAPKQRLSHLMIHTEKLALPSTVKGKQLSSAEAKAAEANASNEAVIAVIKVDLPPSYNEVTPGSPAPSYKSDMLSGLEPVVPGSPAPSYKAVEIPVKASDGAAKSLEPVHGKDSEA